MLKSEVLESFEIVATTLFGLEEILANELKDLGAGKIEIINRAVKYEGNTNLLYRSNLYLRTALKILKPIERFQARNENQLYQKVKQIPWDKYFTFKESFAIDAVVYSETFRHSKYVALKAKDAIADLFRDSFGIRPSVDTVRPDVRINIHVAETTCTVSLDSSGVPLSKRGYRIEGSIAPINEVLAAGMIIMAGWDKKSTFLDPMCGSGTIAIEAAMIAANIAPGRLRSFGFESWKDFDENLWKAFKENAESKIIKPEVNILGRDIDQKPLDSARRNIRRAGLSNIITIKKENFFESEAKDDHGIIVTNPPYGERLGSSEARILELYQEIGTHLKHKYEGWDAWIISSNMEALKFVGLRPSQKIKLFNGALECRFNKYELYRGSKKGTRDSELGRSGDL